MYVIIKSRKTKRNALKGSKEKMDMTKYTMEDLKNSLEIARKLQAVTGDPFYLNMAVAIAEEIRKRNSK